MDPGSNTPKKEVDLNQRACIFTCVTFQQFNDICIKDFWFQSVVNRDGNSKLSSRSKLHIVKQSFRSQLMSGCAACSDVVPGL